MSNKRYTLGEEIFNAVTHGIGSMLSVAGCVILIVVSVFSGSAWNVVSCTIFGSSLIILYTMSTLYHSITNEKAKKVFRILDHATIFLLIAGTYTPITLVTLHGPWGWTLFGIVWGAAVLGIVLNSISIEKFKWFSLICYIAMGWVIFVAIKPFMENIHKHGFLFLCIGGACYTVGIIFYLMKKVKFMHSVWHIFTVAGSIMHYFMVLFYIAPIKIQ